MGTIAELTLNHELNRNTTKTEYKAIQHWLRTCAWVVSERVELARREMMIYGTAVI